MVHGTWGEGYESFRMEVVTIEPKGLFFDSPLNHRTKDTWLHFILGSVVFDGNSRRNQ